MVSRKTADPLFSGKLAEVQAILDRHGITRDAIEAQIDAEQAAMDEGTLVPIRRPTPGPSRRALRQ